MTETEIQTLLSNQNYFEAGYFSGDLKKALRKADRGGFDLAVADYDSNHFLLKEMKYGYQFITPKFPEMVMAYMNRLAWQFIRRYPEGYKRG